MIVYHGSNRRFRKLRVSKELVSREFSELNEGLGIYISLNKSVAASYGKYIYTLEVNDKKLLDFRKKRVCKAYIYEVMREIFKITGFPFIVTPNDVNMIAENIYAGAVAVSGLPRELELLFDSKERWYEYSKTKREQIVRTARRFCKETQQAYLFNYNIPNIGIIKDTSEDVVKIVSCETLGGR